MSFYPIFMDLKDKMVIIIGGGMVAQRKIETFLDYGASISVISKELTPKLEQYERESKIRYLGKEFYEDSLNDATLVIAATNDPILNHRVSKAAAKRGLPVNAVDQPADCSFIVPSIVKNGDLQIAISTSGKSPALAKRIRTELEGKFGSQYAAFLILMGKLRSKIIDQGLSREEKSRIFNEIVESPILDAIEGGDLDEVALQLNKILKIRFTHEDVINLLKDM